MRDTQDPVFLAKVLVWCTEYPVEALDLAMLIIADQCSVIAPEQITSIDEAGDRMRVEVYRGHFVAAREAQVMAYNRFSEEPTDESWN